MNQQVPQMKPTRREEITQLIQDKESAVQQLVFQIKELRKEALLLCDEKQWYEEQVEQVTMHIRGRKVVEDRLTGRVYWNEDFKDVDTGDVITVTRSRIVKADGQWIAPEVVS